MRLIPLLALLSVFVVVTPAHARMYEWTNPATGRVQLSGAPPTWYRAAFAGPRVRVFDNGALVDDTAIRLSPRDNEALREVALAKAAERRQIEALRLLEIASQRETAVREARDREEALLAAAAVRREQRAAETAKTESTPAETTTSTLTPEIPEVIDAQTIERLKALISEFDRIQ